ncbi:MAG: hypothetical protein V9E81_04710 [Marmoricola sp.]
MEEYDYEMIAAAAHDGSPTADDYLTWYRKMLDFFVKLGGEHKGQLVFTGEDYPWGPWNGPEKPPGRRGDQSRARHSQRHH